MLTCPFIHMKPSTLFIASLQLGALHPAKDYIDEDLLLLFLLTTIIAERVSLLTGGFPLVVL